MTWAELEWPNLSPEFPQPVISTPPPARPTVPADVAARVQHGEVRRGRAVYATVALGALLLIAAIAVSLRLPERPTTHAVRVLALVAIGALPFVTFLAAALLALFLGPNWEQRQQHWQLQRWERAQCAWLAGQRAAYLAALSPADRARVVQAIRQD
jgi:hypothetical protein